MKGRLGLSQLVALCASGKGLIRLPRRRQKGNREVAAEAIVPTCETSSMRAPGDRSCLHPCTKSHVQSLWELLIYIEETLFHDTVKTVNQHCHWSKYPLVHRCYLHPLLLLHGGAQTMWTRCSGYSSGLRKTFSFLFRPSIGTAKHKYVSS